MAQVYKCSKCGRQQFAKTRTTPNGLTFEQATWVGWRRNPEAPAELLCPFCVKEEEIQEPEEWQEPEKSEDGE